VGSGFWELVWGSPSFEFGQPLVNVGALLRLARVVAILRDSHNALIYIAKPEWFGLPSTIRTCDLGLRRAQCY